MPSENIVKFKDCKTRLGQVNLGVILSKSDNTKVLTNHDIHSQDNHFIYCSDPILRYGIYGLLEWSSK